MTMHKPSYLRDDIDKKKELENLPALRIASMQQYKNLRITLKRTNKDFSQ